ASASPVRMATSIMFSGRVPTGGGSIATSRTTTQAPTAMPNAIRKPGSADGLAEFAMDLVVMRRERDGRLTDAREAAAFIYTRDHGEIQPMNTKQGSVENRPPGDRGTLWVVATPIGNLDDLSPRARRLL